MEDKSQEEMVREIYETLVGTLDKPGFIEETKFRLKNLEKSKAVIIGVICTVITTAIGGLFL